MNSTNMLSILVEYNKKERSRCYKCEYESKIPHDISQITENIFISDYNTARCKDACIDFDIDAILNVSGISYEPFTFNYDEVDLLDTPTENLSKGFDLVYKFLDFHISQNRKVLVHCMAGMSRSVSYVIYYLMKKEKWNFNIALEYVKARRPIANPNAGFRKQLINL